jgi:hypothetical protein
MKEQFDESLRKRTYGTQRIGTAGIVKTHRTKVKFNGKSIFNLKN